MHMSWDWYPFSVRVGVCLGAMDCCTPVRLEPSTAGDTFHVTAFWAEQREACSCFFQVYIEQNNAKLRELHHRYRCSGFQGTPHSYPRACLGGQSG